MNHKHTCMRVNLEFFYTHSNEGKCRSKDPFNGYVTESRWIRHRVSMDSSPSLDRYVTESQVLVFPGSERNCKTTTIEPETL